MAVLRPGQTVEVREMLHGALWLTYPTTVVADDGDELALLLEPGAPMTYPDHPFGTHPWAPQPAWADTTVLRLYRAGGRHHAVFRFFVDGRADGWYVDFERPVVRGDGWIAVDDWGLDIVVAADGRWRWKDADEPEALVAAGRLDPADLAALRREADAVAALLDSGRPRWWERWADWTPPIRPDPTTGPVREP